MTFICDELCDGKSLTSICNSNETLPSWRTFLRHVKENEEAYEEYRTARTLQCEVMRDEIIDLVEKELPSDPKLAMAEVQRRRLEADHKDKHIRQMMPSGIRNKQEDTNNGAGSITLTWGNSSVEVS